MRCTCAICDICFASINDYQKHICNKEQPKMTREEAIKKFSDRLNKNDVGLYLDGLEKLGLLKFEKEARVVFEINLTSGDVTDNAYKYGKELVNQYGTIRLELWSEGLILWVGGEIRWRSWLDKRPDEVNPV